jgi:LemA protein
VSTINMIELAAAVVVLLIAVSIYNRLVTLGRRCDQSFADIDVQLKQRHDLIPNLVETVKGYATHERGTLDAVMRARSAAQSAATPGAQMQAEAALGSALGRLMAVVEAYPDLQASANFSSLQDELSDIENKIAAARRFLNSAVGEHNGTMAQFPANLVAMLFGLKEKAFFDLGTEQRKVMDLAPAVKF